MISLVRALSEGFNHLRFGRQSEKMSEFSRTLQLQLFGLANASSYEQNRRVTNSFRRQRFNDLPGGRSYPLIDRKETAVKVDSTEKLVQIVNDVKGKTKESLMAGQNMSEAAAES